MITAPLIGWRLAEIAPLAAADTDGKAREVRSHKSRLTAIQLRCQISEKQRLKSSGPGGHVYETRKTILFRIADAEVLSYTPTSGDLLVQILSRSGSVIDSTRMYLDNLKRVSSGTIADAYWQADLLTDAPRRRSV